MASAPETKVSSEFKGEENKFVRSQPITPTDVIGGGTDGESMLLGLTYTLLLIEFNILTLH